MTERAPRATRWQQSGNETPASSRGWRRVYAWAFVVCAALVVGAWSSTAVGAQPAPPPVQRASRADLKARSVAMDRDLASGNLKDKDRSKLQAEAALVKTRLAQGDFHPGDRFLITITQDAASRSDTASVRDSLLVH